MAEDQADLLHVRRQLRVIGILAGAESAGLAPLPSRSLHVVGYFADALAPVWGVSIVDPLLQKRSDTPRSPQIQADVDRLVGRGVAIVADIRHIEDKDGYWRLDATYALNPEFADPILEAAMSLPRFDRELAYLKEVVLAVSGFGALELQRASAGDASYGDELVDIGGMIDIAGDEGPSETARVANRFGEIVGPKFSIGDAEKVHLYMRELYSRSFH